MSFSRFFQVLELSFYSGVYVGMDEHRKNNLVLQGDNLFRPVKKRYSV